MGIEAYDKAVERFTWREQTNNNGVKILSSVYEQTHDGCAAFAVGTTFEARLRVNGIDITLSKEWIDMLDITSPVPKTKVWLMLKALRVEGAAEEGESPTRNFHRLRWYEAYQVQDPLDLLRALKDLITNGPLVAVFKISVNYHECYESKHVYRFDPRRPMTYRKSTGQLEVYTHAVCVVGFSTIEKVPCLECQDSRGNDFSRKGFIYVDISSIEELYSLYV